MIMTAGEFNSQFGKNVHEVFANTSKLYEDGKTYFNKIAFTEDVKERTLKFSSFVESGYASTVGELGLIPTVWALKGHTITNSATDIKDRIVVSSEELYDRGDQTEMLRYVIERTVLGMKSCYNELERQVQSFFNNATTTAIGPDGVPMIANNHTFRAGGTTWSNLMTSTVVGEAMMKELEAYGGNFKDDRNIPYPLQFKVFHVKQGSDAAQELKKLLKINLAGGYQYLAPQSFNGVNIYVGNGYVIHENPYLTDAKKVFATVERDNVMYKNPLYVGMYKRFTASDSIYNTNNDSFEMTVVGRQHICLRNIPVGIVMFQLA